MISKTNDKTGLARGLPGIIENFITLDPYNIHKVSKGIEVADKIQNTLNGPTVQVSPDGGMLQNWYDYLGRVTVAQNAEQKNGSRYSYTSFDEQNRIVEVGEKSSGNTIDASVAFVPAATMTAFAAAGTNSQMVHTWYDKQYDGFGFTQENLRKRISAKSYQDGSSTPQMTYYSYDQIGMVKTLWQQIDGLGTKQIEYNYDLASGKVNKLRYQHLNNDNTTTDQFYYGYEYDADNRVVKSLTGIRGWSNDGWEIENPKTDVHYNYYLHGPLSRSELGNKQLVQGTDYAYTLQGWIKSANSQYLSSAQEMGMDGLAGGDHSVVAPDVFGFTLDYFNADYWAIGNQSFLPLTWGTPATTVTGHNLYNGNISRMTVASAQFGNTVGYSYRYDQLNRLKAMRQHPLTLGATSWDASTAGAAYQEDVTYDGNGNILTYKRNGSGTNGKGVAMDQLTYGYNRDASGYLINNRLTQVTDAVTSNDYGTADLKSQSGNNYGYDLIGNMVSDVQGGVSNITWTIYGKIKKITKSDGSTLEYKYDADGNRVYKVYTHGTQVDKTWYVRDVSGNVLAVYGNKDGDGNVYWKEQQLYGSSRLGSWYPELNIAAGAGGVRELWGSTNKKQYELTNHLGNVLATVSDELKSDNTALVLSASDYYPFGMIQPDRSYSSGGYRYGFNGKENDNEVKGDGNQQDYGMRVYDPRIGRFLSEDPLTPKYPELTPYQFASNTPIRAVDLDGLESAIISYGIRATAILVTGSYNVFVGIDYKGNVGYGYSWSLGFGTGLYIGAGPTITLFPLATLDQTGGYGSNIGANAGIGEVSGGLDLNLSYQQDEKTGQLNDVKLGGSFAIPLPEIAPGAGIEFHADFGNSKFRWIGDLSELENVLKDAVPISPDQIHELVRQATTLQAGLIDIKKTMDAMEMKDVQQPPTNNASTPSRGRSTPPNTPEKANNSSHQNNNQHKKTRSNNSRGQSNDLLSNFST